MATINTNMSANIAANSMTRNERSMSSTMERLSTGLRINSAKDDAAGLAISSKMTSQIRGLNQAVRNSNDAISMVQVAEGAMKEVTNMFQRMRELAVQAISDSNTNADRTALNNEYKQLSQEVQRISENTQWNGTNILDGARTSTTFQIGANANQTIDVNFGDLGTNNLIGTVSGNSSNSVTISLTDNGVATAMASDDVLR
jgi:flagellin